MECIVKTAVENGRYREIPELVQQALSQGSPAEAVLNEIVQAVEYVGKKYQNGALFVSELIVPSLTAKRGIEVLRPFLLEQRHGPASGAGQVILGTAPGDLHDIGKMLLGIAAEIAGFEVIDLGVDVSCQAYMDAFQAHPQCRFIAISAMLETSVDVISSMIREIRSAGLDDQVKIVVGGAAFSQVSAAAVGADLYAPDVNSTVKEMKALLGQQDRLDGGDALPPPVQSEH